MKEGTVTLFNVTKAWGFVKEDGGQEWFFHFANSPGLEKSVRLVGARVTFEIIPPLRLGQSDQAANLVIVQPAVESAVLKATSLAGNGGAA